MKNFRFLFLTILSLTALKSQAQELVVLECGTESGKWFATIEVDLKNRKIKYDNAIARFASDQWNRFKKEYAEKNNSEYEVRKYEPYPYEVTKITNSEIHAKVLGWSSGNDLIINRYTLTLKDETGEYKCQKKQKEF